MTAGGNQNSLRLPNFTRKSVEVLNEEVPSPVKPVGYLTPPVKMKEIENAMIESV